jgi:putative FmdB family regulatory protein
MPTYDYKCLDCHHTFEFFQSMMDDPLIECPQCSGELKRLIGTGVGPIFKGSGFYQTDYKTNGNSEKKIETATSKSEAKTITKPEPKTDKKTKA